MNIPLRILAQHSDRGSFGEVSWVEMLTVELSLNNLPVTIELLKVTKIVES